MILSCSTGGLPFFEENELFSKLNNANVSIFELLVYSRYNDLQNIANIINQFDISIASVHVAKKLGDMFFTEVIQELELYKTKFKENLQLAKAIGAKLIVLHGWNYTTKKLDPYQLVQKWNDLRDQTQEAQLELSIELVPAPTREFSISIFSAIDEDLDTSISLTLDTESAAWSGYFSEFLERINRIGNVHIKDYDGCPMGSNGRRRYLKPGEGNINFKSIFKNLKEAKYRRSIVLEAPHQTIDELNRTLTILNSMMED